MNLMSQRERNGEKDELVVRRGFVRSYVVVVAVVFNVKSVNVHVSFQRTQQYSNSYTRT